MAIGPNNIGPKLSSTIECEMCGQLHEIKDSIGTTTDEHGNKKIIKGSLHYFTCGGQTYIVGINGKSIVSN